MKLRFSANCLVELDARYKSDNNFFISGVSSLSNPKDNTLLFLKRVKPTMLEKLNGLHNCIMVVPEPQKDLLNSCASSNLIVGSDNPRLEYAIILHFILNYNKQAPQNDHVCLATAIGEGFKMGEGTTIEHNVIIGDNVQIGRECVIKAGVVISSNVIVGDYTIIRENAVIGGSGFGFERDENDIPIRLPHIGGVIIGKHVEIGAMTTVCAGTIEPTIIEDYTKIDDHVHIAHNCHIGQKCLITACAEVSGSVSIGDSSWLGPNCSIINGIIIGKNCFIGIGAVVTKSVSDDIIVTGNPARPLEDIKYERDLYNELLRTYKNGKLQFKE